LLLFYKKAVRPCLKLGNYIFNSLQEIRQQVFDYKKWKVWLEGKKSELQTLESTVSLRCGPDNGPKPGMTFGIIGPNAMGSFEVWITGETDYTVMAPPSQGAEIVSNKWMVISNDETFERTFNEFVAEFTKHNSASKSGMDSSI
jgi:hypothetical protein